MAHDLGFTGQDAQTVATAVSELVRNILKYAGMGEVRIDEVRKERNVGIRITASDRGPGIDDLEAAMSDHYSSSGTLGLGLPGVRRMMDEFEIGSTPGKGTDVVVFKWSEPPAGRTDTKFFSSRPAKKMARRRSGETVDIAVIRSFGPRETRLSSAAGTLGHQIRTPQEHRMQLGKANVLVLYTDGIKERFELEDYPQLRYQSASVIAETIVDRFGKSHDDASCIVFRHKR